MKTAEEIELIESLGLGKRLSFVVHYIIEAQTGSDQSASLLKASAWLNRELKCVQAKEQCAARAVDMIKGPDIHPMTEAERSGLNLISEVKGGE